jgi:hypothetical protein
VSPREKEAEWSSCRRCVWIWDFVSRRQAERIKRAVGKIYVRWIAQFSEIAQRVIAGRLLTFPQCQKWPQRAWSYATWTCGATCRDCNTDHADSLSFKNLSIILLPLYMVLLHGTFLSNSETDCSCSLCFFTAENCRWRHPLSRLLSSCLSLAFFPEWVLFLFSLIGGNEPPISLRLVAGMITPTKLAKNAKVEGGWSH